MLFEADDKLDPKKEDDKLKTEIEGVAENVATLRVPSILEALHENALSKCGAAEKNVELVNSAFTDKNGKVSLETAGEQLISVIPKPEAEKFKKADAIAILKAYVQWFVGPDLASKVNDSTVKALDESPDLKESRQHFMSFKQFLLEADEKEKTLEDTMKDGESKPEETKEEKPAEGEEGKEKTLEDTMKDSEEKEKASKKEDGKDKKGKQKGYYITYGLKVEGLKQTALKDAMKKSAKTFFDDLKFTASGLFGGGDSFTVKDVKDKWNEAFGPIDPDDLVEKVRQQIEDISNPNTDRPEVKIRDKTTLIQDLGNNISGKQKQQIDSAEYSIWIEVSEFDPKKPIFNKRVVADIVTSSIKGLWKKFSNKVTADDVIYLEDFADTHEDTVALKALQGLVKSPKEVEAIIDRESKSSKSTANTAFKKIKDIIDPLEKDKQYKNSQLAQACVKVFKEFENKHSNVEELSKIKSDKIKELFKGFLDAYEKAYKKYYDKKLEESISKLKSLKFMVNLKKLVLESLLDEDENAEDETVEDAKPVKYSDIKNYVDSYVQPEPESVSVSEKEAIIDACKLLDPAPESAEAYKAFKDTDTYNSAILVDYTELAKSAKSLDESSSLKNDILNILLSDDLLNEVEKDNKKKKSKKSKNEDNEKDSKKETPVDENLLLNTLTKALTDNGVKPDSIEKKLIKLTKKVMSESVDLLNEAESVKANSSDPRKFFNSTNKDKKASKIEKEFYGNLQNIDTRLANTVTGIFGSIDYVQKALDKGQLSSPDIASKAGKNKYVFAVPIQLPLKDKDGKFEKVPKSDGTGTKKCMGTRGASKLDKDNVLEAMKSALEASGIKGKINNFFSYQKDSKEWKYYETDHPAKCKVYLGFVKSIKPTDPPRTPEPQPTPPSDKKEKYAYILPFNVIKSEKPIKTDDIDVSDDIDVNAKGRKDVYIVPMKGLRYKDKEYDTYA